MEGAIAAAEGRVGDEAAPELANERGADEARRLSGLDAEEDHSDEVVHQLRQRPAAAATEGTATGLADVAGRRLRRRHAAPWRPLPTEGAAEGFRSRGASERNC